MAGPEKTPKPAAARSYTVSSVDNALTLLSLLRDYPSLSVKEGAELLGVAPSTAHRLLSTLQVHGFVAQDPATRRYAAGPALLQVALSSLRRVDVRRVARPHLVALAAETRATASLAVAEGVTVRYLDSIEGPDIVRVRATTGETAPAHLTAIGKAMLAALSETDVVRLYPAKRLLAVDGTTSLARKDLLDELARIRQVGAAISADDNGLGLGAVGVPIVDVDGSVLAGIGVSVPPGDFDEATGRQLADAARNRARRIEDELHR